MVPTIDVNKMVSFMVGLLDTHSPTGDTDRAINYVKNAFAAELTHIPMSIAPKGYLVGKWAGESSDKPRGLTAHVDTLGAMVQMIKENGRLQITQLGGWSWTSVEGEAVTIYATSGKRYRGTILPTTASIHAHTRAARNEQRNETNMEVRIDAHTSTEEETKSLGICVGDIIAFDARVEETEYGFIRSRHLDDKASVAAIYGALMAIKEAGLQPKQDTIIHISNYEEVGHGAAAGFPQNLVDLMCIDMAVVAPNQTSNEYAVTICAKDSSGPYHLAFRRELESLADAHKIKYCTDIYPYYGSDGSAYWRAGGDVRVSLIGPGVDASHHYERTHRDALENSAKLIAAYLLS